VAFSTSATWLILFATCLLINLSLRIASGHILSPLLNPNISVGNFKSTGCNLFLFLEHDTVTLFAYAVIGSRSLPTKTGYHTSQSKWCTVLIGCWWWWWLGSMTSSHKTTEDGMTSMPACSQPSVTCTACHSTHLS